MKPLIEASWPDCESAVFFLAIQNVNAEQGWFHAAVLYMCEKKLMIGDLQGHMRTRRAEARSNNRIFWVAPDLVVEDQKILASKLDAWLVQNENSIPYSVAHPGGVIFRGNIWVGNEPAQGLTCATFIVELFDELGIPFLDKRTWQARPGDEEWASCILNLMDDMPEEHKSAQYDRIGEAVRVRPSDTFAAGILISKEMEAPLEFCEVYPRAEVVEREFLNN